MFRLRGQVVSFLCFWAFTLLLVSALFLRGKAAEASRDILLAPPPEISVEATNLSAVDEAEATEPEEGSTIRRRFSVAERQAIRHANINVPQ